MWHYLKLTFYSGLICFLSRQSVPDNIKPTCEILLEKKGLSHHSFLSNSDSKQVKDLMELTTYLNSNIIYASIMKDYYTSYPNNIYDLDLPTIILNRYQGGSYPLEGVYLALKEMPKGSAFYLHPDENEIQYYHTDNHLLDWSNVFARSVKELYSVKEMVLDTCSNENKVTNDEENPENINGTQWYFFSTDTNKAEAKINETNMAKSFEYHM